MRTCAAFLSARLAQGISAMILKASKRGGARKLALHLLNEEDNDHVEVHEVRGFMSQNLVKAFSETYAISKGTRCTNFFFSQILSPPENEVVPDSVFLEVNNEIEETLNLKGQARAIIFHEKKGRRHAHAVWSRIDVQKMKAIELPLWKTKLNAIAKLQYIKHGWKMPQGFINKQAHDPTNFTMAEYHQAKRSKMHPKEIKILIQDAWGISDSRDAFEHALRERGYWLARGDRKGFVVIDSWGEIRSLPRSLDTTIKVVECRLGKRENLRSVEETLAVIAKELTPGLRQYLIDAQSNYTSRKQALLEKKDKLKAQQITERKALRERQNRRWRDEQAHRQQRLPKGLKGLWSRLNGAYARIRTQNEQEIEIAKQRDNSETQIVRSLHLVQRSELQKAFIIERQHDQRLTREIHADIARHIEAEKQYVELSQLTETEQEQRQPRRQRKRRRNRRKQEMEPGF